MRKESASYTFRKTLPFDSKVSQDMSEIKGDVGKTLYRYWQQKRGDKVAPEWRDFDFMDLHKIAPVLLVVDVDPSMDPNKLRYRYMGTEIVGYRRHRAAPDLTGRTFEEGERPYDTTPLLAAYAQCMNDVVPILISGEYQTENWEGQHERLIVPWLIDGKAARLMWTVDRYSTNKIDRY